MKFTLETFISLIEKNGLPHKKHATFISYANPSLGACALGQAYWNLHNQPTSIIDNQESEFWRLFYRWQEQHSIRNENDVTFNDRIVYLNDELGLSLGAIATILRTEFKDFLNYDFDSQKAYLDYLEGF